MIIFHIIGKVGQFCTELIKGKNLKEIEYLNFCFQKSVTLKTAILNKFALDNHLLGKEPQSHSFLTWLSSQNGENNSIVGKLCWRNIIFVTLG